MGNSNDSYVTTQSEAFPCVKFKISFGNHSIFIPIWQLEYNTYITDENRYSIRNKYVFANIRRDLINDSRNIQTLSFSFNYLQPNLRCLIKDTRKMKRSVIN